MPSASSPASASAAPFGPAFELGGQSLTSAEVIALLGPRLSERRLARLRATVAERSFSIPLVLDGLLDYGNISAILRSAEALGFPSVQIVDIDAPMKISTRTTRDADKWLEVTRWPNPTACLSHLKERGYRLLATALTPQAVDLSTVDFSIPTALILGNEHLGVSATSLAMADQCAIIPTVGLGESLNVSVAAALAMWLIRQDRQRRLGRHGDLSEAGRQALLAEYIRRAVPDADWLAGQLLARQRQPPTPSGGLV